MGQLRRVEGPLVDPPGFDVVADIVVNKDNGAKELESTHGAGTGLFVVGKLGSS